MLRAVRLTLGTTWSGTGCRQSKVASLPEAGWDDERPRVWSVLQPSRRAGRHERGHRPDGGDRRVARTRLVVDGVTVTVSTVHLVFDHQYSDGPPLIFETMVFGIADDNPQWRYSTEEEAKLGHQKVVELLRLRVPDGLGVADWLRTAIASPYDE